MDKMFITRRAEIASKLPKDSVLIVNGAAISYRNADTSFSFRQDSNFWYLSGFNEPDATIFIKNLNGKINTYIFVQPKDKLKEIWDGYIAGPSGAKSDYGFDFAYDNNELEKKAPGILQGASKVLYEIGKTPEFDKKVNTWIRVAESKDRHSHKIDPSDATETLGMARLIKSDSEITLIGKACEISANAHMEAMKFVKPGLNEQDLEAFYVYQFAKNGGRFVAYNPIIAGGENACILHYVDNSDPLQDGDLVLVDAGAEYQNYASDITRTYPVNGKFSSNQLAIYEIVLEAHKQAIESVKPGRSVIEPQKISERVITQGLIDLKILKGSLDENIENETYKQFYMHKIGHWMGLDVHDAGAYMENNQFRKFEPGMVTTIEPGIYISSDADVADDWKGIGIRIEDDILVTKEGNNNLTSAVPSSPKEIEALMA